MALWLVLFAAYAATLGIPAFGTAQYGGDEPHHLLIAESIVSDGDADLRDEYAERAYADWYPYDLSPRGELDDGHPAEPLGIGFALVIAPAYAVAGPVGVQLLLGALAALAFVLGAALAQRIVPDPWAWMAALGCGLSPPVLAHATTVTPELVAAAALTGAALLALRARELPRIRRVAGAAVLLAALPWLGLRFLLGGAVVACALLGWLRRRAPGFAVLVLLETLLFTGVVYITVNERLFDGFTPHSADAPGSSPTGADSAGEYLDRVYRLVALWLDRTYGLLRWAPVLALAFLGAWLLWRSRRDNVARALPGRRDAEVAATLCALVCGAQVLVAGVLAPTMFGFWFPARDLVAVLPLAAGLCAWGLRRAPRAGAVLLGLTLVTSAWLLAELRIDGGGWIGPSSRAPLGHLEGALPLFASGSTAADAVLYAAFAATLALAAWELRRWRARSA